MQIFLLWFVVFFPKGKVHFLRIHHSWSLKKMLCVFSCWVFFPLRWAILIPGIIKFAAFFYKHLPRHCEDEYLLYLHVTCNSQHFWVYLCYKMNLCFLPTILQQSIEVLGFTLPQPSRLCGTWSIIHTAVDFDINYLFFFIVCTILLHVSFLCSCSAPVYNFIFSPFQVRNPFTLSFFFLSFLFLFFSPQWGCKRSSACLVFVANALL